MPADDHRSGEVLVRHVVCSVPAGGPSREIVAAGGHEVYLVRRGCFAYRTAGADLLVDATSCLLGGPGQEAEVAHPYGGGDTGTAVHVSAALVAGVGRDSLDLPPTARTTPGIARTHRALVAACAAGAEPELVEELAVGLLAAALGQAEPARVAAGRRDGAERRRRLFDDARAAMVADPSLASVVDVARVVGCSPHHLSRVFTAHTGSGVSGYRRALRLHDAVEQMLDGGRTLAEVAASCGFADHAHLTRTMRAVHGLTPSQLRSLVGEPAAARPPGAQPDPVTVAGSTSTA